uniref:Tyrosine-protein kinase n=1 Tax=Phallusia mammillata TaxID=59560 RepID=A0A6F9DUS1_9ASCI|nr:tyrosine-protein kinase SYK-like [Phallusia mammillata]
MARNDSIEMDFSNAPYYHGEITRFKAKDILTGKANGSFLLRKSLNKPNAFALSVAHEGNVLNYSIQLSPDANLYRIDQGAGFKTPVELCEHYSQDKGGLRVKLMYPIGLIRTSSIAHSVRSLTLSNPDSSYESNEWFHGNITREEDAYRLSCDYRRLRRDGIFLVREKENNFFALSLVHCAKVHRYKICFDTTARVYKIVGKQKCFDSLASLVDFYRQYRPDGLLCALEVACTRNSNRPACPFPNQPKVKTNIVAALAKRLEKIMPKNSLEVSWDDSKEENQQSSPRPKSQDMDMSKQNVLSRFNRKSMPRDSIGFQSPYRNLANSEQGEIVAPDLYITNDKVTVGREIGRGHFGSVNLGECEIHGQFTPCAVKSMSGNDVQANKNELLREVSIMQKLDHPYIVRVLAVCDSSRCGNELKIVLELAPLGDLKSFLKRHIRTSLPEEQLLTFVIQVCDGMAYLSSQNVVHRDLAARNVLMVSEHFVKISDFGMSRILHDSENYYKAAKPGAWPVRWYAPESLLYYKFTTKGDVWSFGVTLWEVFSYGNKPYQNMKGQEILNMLEAGHRLECPCGCSPGAYTLMLQCWAHEGDQRPTFTELLPQLQHLLNK